MTQTFYVQFVSDALDSPEYIGPFYSEDDAYEYADDRNDSLALSGIPSSVASYSVEWHKPFTLDSLMRIEFQKRFPFMLSWTYQRTLTEES